MAAKNGTHALVGAESYDVLTVTWETITSTNTNGSPAEIPEWSDKTIQVVGTWGGATASVEGSNDGTNYSTLHDLLGNTLFLTSDGITSVMETTRYIRPSSAGGDGTQDLDFILLARRPNNMRT